MNALKITTKDRVFAALAIPAALAIAYLHFVHAPLQRRVDAMRGRMAELGDAAEIRALLPALENRRAEARARRDEAERDEAARIAQNGAVTGDDAARLSRLASLFSEAGGVRVTATERLDDGDSAAAGLVREATGVASPSLWRFTLLADYDGIMRALEMVANHDSPSIVEAVALEGAGGRRPARIWKIDVRL